MILFNTFPEDSTCSLCPSRKEFYAYGFFYLSVQQDTTCHFWLWIDAGWGGALESRSEICETLSSILSRSLLPSGGAAMADTASWCSFCRLASCTLSFRMSKKVRDPNSSPTPSTVPPRQLSVTVAGWGSLRTETQVLLLTSHCRTVLSCITPFFNTYTLQIRNLGYPCLHCQ